MMKVALTAEEIEIQREFNQLLAECTRCNKRGDKALIRKAFKLSFDAHKGMRRKSGELYILHPLSVARIVNQEIGLGAKSIICALLHDVVEDTEYTLEDIERMFGPKIASITDGLTKISGVFDANTSRQAENFRKILLTLSDDIRVILIKIADRLHNMRTLNSLPLHKQMKIASETIYLFAPLAHRLGLYTIKTELEDLSLKYLYPKVFEELETKLKKNETSQRVFLEEFKSPIESRLKSFGLQFEITARQKSIYSIWQKMQKKNVPFEEIYDLMAIRIVFDPIEDVPEKTQCWNIYSLITDIYMPKPERIRDWVSTPKANGYEALHATVMGPKGHWVEVQIRSRRMDEIAEKGFAAHWKYKDEKSSYEAELDKWIKRLTELLEDPNSDALEFLDDLKLNLFSSEIFIFTPKGDIKTMPTEAIALDFAYEIHSHIGHKAIGAKVNHKLVALNHQLKSGDQVEIITSEKPQSRIEWLQKVHTAKAKTAIKASLKSETKNRIEKGKKMLETKLEELKLKPSNRIFRKLLPNYMVTSKDELYSKIGIGIIQLDDLNRVLKKNTKNKWIRYWSLQFGSRSRRPEKELNGNEVGLTEPLFLRENLDSAENEYIIAQCCNPIPGDDVVGIKDEMDQVIIHKANCRDAIKLSSGHGHRIVKVQWTTHKYYSFLVKIAISGIDRFGVYNDITTTITKQLNVNIRNINLESHDGIWDGTMELYVHNTKDLNLLIMNIVKIKGVESVHRMENLVV
jgi:GTP diphosphokinase / guanosine-3',5'-bis(diphosphate) 3'-diphosphatase